MSLSTWKAEYYPVEARDATGSALEAAKHSLRKWIGLRGCALSVHGVRLFKNERSVLEVKDDQDSVEITHKSCALCALCEKDSDIDCEICPLFQVLGFPCSGEGDDEGPFDIFIRNHNPEPMIAALKESCKQESANAERS